MLTWGRGGGQKSENLADIICERPLNVTSNPKPMCPTFWFEKLFVCEELRLAVGGEGTLVALLVARQPVVQPAAAGWGRKLPGGYQGGAGSYQRVTRGEQGPPWGSRGLPRGSRGLPRGSRGLPGGAEGYQGEQWVTKGEMKGVRVSRVDQRG